MLTRFNHARARVEHLRAVKELQVFAALITDSGLMRFSYNAHEDSVCLEGKLVSYESFNNNITPAYKKTIDKAMLECFKTSRPVVVLFDAYLTDTKEPSAYRLLLHPFEGLILGVFQLAYNGQALGESPTIEHLTYLSNLPTSILSIPLSTVLIQDSPIANLNPALSASQSLPLLPTPTLSSTPAPASNTVSHHAVPIPA